MKEHISHYFFRRAASSVHITKLIPALEDGESRLREISKNIGMSYVNISQVMQDAHREGLINRERVNNSWSFELTPKGRALCELCKGVTAVINNWRGEVTVDYLNKLSFGEEKEVIVFEDNVIRKSEVVKNEEK